MRRWPVAVAVGCLLAGGAAVRAGGPLRSGGAYPSPQALVALERVEEPSSPQPLTGDPEVMSATFEHAAGCDAIRASYLGPGAPLPTGAESTVDASGNLQVAAPFGASAVIMADSAAGTCRYLIAKTPTLTFSIDGAAAVTAFTNVACTTVVLFEFVGADFTSDGVARFLYIVQGATVEQWGAGVVDGVLRDVLAGDDDPQPGFAGTLSTTEDGQRVFEGDGPGGHLRAEFTCTPFAPLPALTG